MELHLIGKPNAPALVLLGSSPALEPLKKTCLLLLPSFAEEATEDEKLAALEKELLLHYGGRIRGVYAFGSSAGLALRLYAGGRLIRKVECGRPFRPCDSTVARSRSTPRAFCSFSVTSAETMTRPKNFNASVYK